MSKAMPVWCWRPLPADGSSWARRVTNEASIEGGVTLHIDGGAPLT